MAIRLGRRYMIPGEIAVRARPILYDDGLAQGLLEIVGNLPRQGVRRPAGDECHDKAHWPRRIILRTGDARHDREGGSSRCHTQELTARKHHDAAPFMSRLLSVCGLKITLKSLQCSRNDEAMQRRTLFLALL